MFDIWIYSLVSVLLVSAISLIGIFALSLNEKRLKEVLLYLVALSVGGLFGDAFIHLIPEASQEMGLELETSLYILVGIIIFFIVEKLVRWRHCHIPTSEEHPHPFTAMNLVGDSVHNFIDGLIIGASYMASIPIGLATTLAVVFHEIPQEIGDFGILMHGGFSRSKALTLNFLTALTAVLGTIFSLLLAAHIKNLTFFLTLFAAGGFIYIAGSDLVPELHKEIKLKKSVLQLLALIVGVIIMFILRLTG